MIKIENISILFTIVYGLALADLLTSLHRLIRDRQKVRWHWLPLTAAWYVLLVIFKNWWSLIGKIETQYGGNVYIFFVQAHVLLLVYLLASSALPDDVSQDGVDLRGYYFGNRKYFWGVMAAINLGSIFINVLGNSIVIDNLIIQLIFVLLFGSLAWIKRYWYHSIVMIVVFIALCLEVVFRFGS